MACSHEYCEIFNGFQERNSNRSKLSYSRRCVLRNSLNGKWLVENGSHFCITLAVPKDDCVGWYLPQMMLWTQLRSLCSLRSAHCTSWNFFQMMTETGGWFASNPPIGLSWRLVVRILTKFFIRTIAVDICKGFFCDRSMPIALRYRYDVNRRRPHFSHDTLRSSLLAG
jgi:hypothetical protein